MLGGQVEPSHAETLGDAAPTLRVENSVSGGEKKRIMRVKVPPRLSPTLKNGRMRRLLQGQICGL
nr:hypothetical protein [Nostoc sp. ChiSLP03a]